jgi:hypothetical protein
MTFKVQDFLTQVRDLARNYQFQAEIIFPAIVGNDITGFTNILAESTSLPVKTIEEVDASFMGQPIKLAGMLNYPTWTVNFRVDDNYEVYKRFRAWSELVVGTETNIASFPTQYKTNCNFYQLDGAGNRILSYTLYGTWVSSLQEETLDYSNRNISILPINFEYDFFLQKIL